MGTPWDCFNTTRRPTTTVAGELRDDNQPYAGNERSYPCKELAFKL
jgi:hypothetical protein